MTPILFVSHDARRTGAPLVLLHLCRWLARHHSRPFEIVLGGPGELEADFAALAPTTVLDRHGDPESFHAGLDALRARADRGEFALLYANTVETVEWVAACAPYVPVVTHVHELETWIRSQTGLDRFAQLAECTDRFLAVSHAVARTLVRLDVPSASVRVMPGCIDTARWAEKRTDDLGLRAELGIPASALIVGGVGAPGWRKGTDVFLQVARLVRERVGDRVHFVWVGGLPAGLDARLLEARHDADRLGVAPVVHFVGHRPDPAPYFSMFDVFTLTSREDSYPLVMLEAAACGLPIVCFDEAGGAPEFVGQDCGHVVPYLDMAAMADRLLSLLESPLARARAGETGRSKVRARHDVATTARQIAALIEAAIEDGPSENRLIRMADGGAWDHVAALVMLYRMGSRSTERHDVARARRQLTAVVEHGVARHPELAGKACFKLAGLASSEDERVGWLERAVSLCPSHNEAARQLRALRERQASIVARDFEDVPSSHTRSS